MALPGEVSPTTRLCVYSTGPTPRSATSSTCTPRVTTRIWIEGERIENPPEGGAGTIFDREPMGTVYITCAPEYPILTSTTPHP